MSYVIRVNNDAAVRVVSGTNTDNSRHCEFPCIFPGFIQNHHDNPRFITTDLTRNRELTHTVHPAVCVHPSFGTIGVV